MQQRLRGFYLFISSLVIGLLSVPFAFAKTAGSALKMHLSPEKGVAALSDSLLLSPVKSLYDSIHLNVSGLSQQAFEYARRGFQKLLAEGSVMNDSILAIVDFSQPSSQKRLYIIDLKNHSLLFNTLVAHGRNSGRERAEQFSNAPASFKSSTGFYITGTTYQGKNGYSLKLDGVEPGINDRAFDRGIVIHGAAYVSDDLIRSQGYIGRSEGCPAVPPRMAAPVINILRNGTCLYIYHPAAAAHSRLVH